VVATASLPSLRCGRRSSSLASFMQAVLPTYSRTSHHSSPNLPQPPEQSFNQLMNDGGFGLQKKLIRLPREASL
jgi:hypothetical protein